ncbi:MAG: hypothetical protein ABI468_08995 [Candidatus Nanopelagicales bacterium]
MLARTSRIGATDGGAVVSWANAWLFHLASLDEADLAANGAAAGHRIAGVPGEEAPVPWSITWGRLRSVGVDKFSLALPVAGDPLGLRGPPPFNATATAAGVAVIASGKDVSFGLVPDADSGGVLGWQVTRLLAPVPGLGLLHLNEAQHDFDDVLRDAAADLAEMDLARVHPAAAAAAERCDRVLRAQTLSPVLSAGAARLLASALRLNTLVSLAMSDDGAAVTAGEAQRRREVLTGVERVTRRAVVAAYSSVPPP